MFRVEATTMIKTPRKSGPTSTPATLDGRMVLATSGARLIRREVPTLILDVDHLAGKVIDDMVGQLPMRPSSVSPAPLHAGFLNRFKSVPGRTRVTSLHMAITAATPRLHSRRLA